SVAGWRAGRALPASIGSVSCDRPALLSCPTRRSSDLDQQLKLLEEREAFRKKQNYLYGGIAAALLFGLVFMFVSYHFRLRYAIEREKKLQKEKEDAEYQTALQLQIEKEEQARLKAEQELLHLKREQLEKEALANSLIIEHKNEMLKQIQGKIQDGEAGDIQKLLKE